MDSACENLEILKKMPKFSIIISTYNMANSINNAIESILTQEFESYEIIVYNDASTDDTEKIIIKNDKIVLINGKENIGLGAARNTALKQAKGEYILYLDADDTLYEKTTLKKINEVVERKNPDLAYFGVHYIGGSNKTYIPNKENSTKEARILCDMHFAVSSKCWKKSFLEEKNITFIENMYYEDMVYSIKATILAETIDYGEFPIYNYTRGKSGSIMSTPNLKRCVDMYIMLSHVMELYEITPKKYQPYLLSFIKQETQSIPLKIGEILRCYNNGINNPVFPKRKYKFDENDNDIYV